MLSGTSDRAGGLVDSPGDAVPGRQRRDRVTRIQGVVERLVDALAGRERSLDLHRDLVPLALAEPTLGTTLTMGDRLADPGAGMVAVMPRRPRDPGQVQRGPLGEPRRDQRQHQRGADLDHRLYSGLYSGLFCDGSGAAAGSGAEFLASPLGCKSSIAFPSASTARRWRPSSSSRCSSSR